MGLGSALVPPEATSTRSAKGASPASSEATRIKYGLDLGLRPRKYWDEVGRKTASTAPAGTTCEAKATHASAAMPLSRGRASPTDTSRAPPPATCKLLAVKVRPDEVVGVCAKNATPPTVVEDTVVSRNTAGRSGREGGEGRTRSAAVAVTERENSQGPGPGNDSLSPRPRAVMV